MILLYPTTVYHSSGVRLAHSGLGKQTAQWRVIK